MPRGNQLSRQWRLLQIIGRPAGVTVEDAARELESTQRTIWRDISVLENAGFPIWKDKDTDGRRSVWRVHDDFRARLPLTLTLGELAALVMSRELLAPVGASVLGPAVASAYDKITSVLGRDALALLDQMRQTVGVRALGAKLQAPTADLVPRIHIALAERRTARIRFNGGLYLVAHCHLRQAVRIFAVERMRTFDLRRDRFTPPPDFDATRYLENAWGILRGDLVTVRVLFSRAVAPYIRERLWHPSQVLRSLDDGRLEVTLRVADTLEVRRWILGYGVDAEVVAPEALREALRAEADALTQKLSPRRPPLAAAGSSRVARRASRQTARRVAS